MDRYARSLQEFNPIIFANPKLPRILIEGDSWADIPIPNTSNLSWQLYLYLKRAVCMLNISKSGDLLDNIVQLNHCDNPKQNELISLVANSRLDFDILVFSAGGNDVLANSDGSYAMEYLIQAPAVVNANTTPQDYLTARFYQLLEKMKDQYFDLLSCVLEKSSKIKIVLHTYDFISPRNKAFKVFGLKKGPWVWPTVSQITSDQQLQRAICTAMLDKYRELVLSLSRINPARIFVVDTQGTIPLPNTPWSDDIQFWNDEIHPTSMGFKMLVENKIGPQVKALL
jgi:hypothetical protein